MSQHRLLLVLPVMQAKQLAEWGVEGVIVGSALVNALGEAPTPVRRRGTFFSYGTA